MKTKLVVAALVAATLAVPAAPAMAAHAAPPANCLILPMLQAECREAIREHAEAHRAQVEATTGLPTPPWWRCRPAAEGAGYLVECD